MHDEHGAAWLQVDCQRASQLHFSQLLLAIAYRKGDDCETH
jgi:hypothetical protein